LVVGYEVKISRSDLRSELLNPAKRMEAVSRCTQFYIAVPSGLLKSEELEFKQPDWAMEDFQRQRCPGIPERRLEGHRYRTFGGQCSNPRVDLRGRARRYVPRDTPKGYTVKVPVPAVLGTLGMDALSPYQLELAIDDQGFDRVPCPTCGGSGYTSKSRAELEAPYLWIPPDVGLIEVDGRGCHVAKPAPRNKFPKLIVGDVPSDAIPEDVRNRMQRQAVADIVRWASNRPDPRHI
jgi:hypothetical protein